MTRTLPRYRASPTESGLEVEEPTETPGADDDPLTEVNVYIAYERYDQAEELIRDAIGSHPNRLEYRVRLLEVMQAARNVAGFQAEALALREAVGEDSPLIEQAAQLWAELVPGRRYVRPAAGRRWRT